jgi:hypothetical protein
MSNEERISWVSLTTNLVVGYWYFSRVLALPADANLHFQFHLVTKVIVLAVVIAIAGEMTLRWLQARSGERPGKSAPRDERDLLIGLKAARTGYVVLGVCVSLVLGQILLLEWVNWYLVLHGRPLRVADTVLELLVTGPLTPMLIVQLLLAALTVGGIALYASRIYFYRRGS